MSGRVLQGSSDGFLRRTLLKEVWTATLQRHRPHHLQKSRARVGQIRSLAVHQTQQAVEAKFGYRHLDQLAAIQFLPNCQAGHQGDTVSHGHETLDGFEAGQFHAHIKRRVVGFEGRDHSAPQRRRHVVSDEVFRAKIANRDLRLLRQRMIRVYDEGEVIPVHDNRLKRIRGLVGHDADLGGTLDQFVGNLAGERPLDGDSNLRTELPKTVENREQVKTGIFIGSQLQAAPLERTQLQQGAGGLVSKADQFQGIFAEQFSGGGQGSIPGRALKEWFPEIALQFTNHLADSGLGAMQASRRAREAPLFSDGKKRFQLVDVHKDCSRLLVLFEMIIR